MYKGGNSVENVFATVAKRNTFYAFIFETEEMVEKRSKRQRSKLSESEENTGIEKWFNVLNSTQEVTKLSPLKNDEKSTERIYSP